MSPPPVSPEQDLPSRLSDDEKDKARVQVRAQLPPGTRLKVTLELLDSRGELLQQDYFLTEEPASRTEIALRTEKPQPLTAGLENLSAWLRDLGPWFGLALGVYLLVRIIGLADYPIYFFTDEAAQTVLAADLVRDGMYSPDREFLPTYFKNVYQYNLGVSVYLQVLPLQLFGKSVEVTRGVNVLVSLLAALACGLALKRIFHNRYPWIAVLVLSATPAWFLHSRTAFETSLGVSFYAGFLYCYLLYRGGQPRAIYAALVFGALSFYSYSPAQFVLALTTLLLGISDWRYHWQQRKILLRAFLLGLVLALPYLRFQFAHPSETLSHLKQIGSYWIQPISLWEKLGRYASQYLQGLNPVYWYADPGHIDLERHTMNGYGHLLRYTLPFGLLGTALALKNWRFWAYRALLIAALAAPGGAALAEIGITRALFMVIPSALLTALGISAVLEWLIRRLRYPRRAVAVAFGLLLGGFNFFLLGDALLNGPTWSTQYTLSGMQYGARQVFNAAQEYAAAHPGSHMVLSPTWANGTDMLQRFFLPDSSPVELASIEAYLVEYRPFDEGTVFILPPEEYQRAVVSNKFSTITPLASLPYPDGATGFYFVKLRYVDGIQDIFRAESEALRAMISAEIDLAGEKVQIRHSRLDMGQLKDIFDGNPDTMVRTMAANPLHLQVDFPTPRLLSAVVLRVGSTATTFEVVVQVRGEEKPRVFARQLAESSVLRDLRIDFDETLSVAQIYFRIKNTYDSEPGHVHLWEVTFR